MLSVSINMCSVMLAIISGGVCKQLHYSSLLLLVLVVILAIAVVLLVIVLVVVELLTQVLLETAMKKDYSGCQACHLNMCMTIIKIMRKRMEATI